MNKMIENTDLNLPEDHLVAKLREVVDELAQARMRDAQIIRDLTIAMSHNRNAYKHVCNLYIDDRKEKK